MITLKIAGTKYYNTSAPKFGARLQLIADPDNSYDSNAIKVCDEDGDQLGHVPAAAAAVMTLVAQKTGVPVEVYFTATMQDGENFGVDLSDEHDSVAFG